jgi:hypothetical protein
LGSSSALIRIVPDKQIVAPCGRRLIARRSALPLLTRASHRRRAETVSPSPAAASEPAAAETGRVDPMATAKAAANTRV